MMVQRMKCRMIIVMTAMVITVAVCSCGTMSESHRSHLQPLTSHLSKEDSLKYRYFFIEAVRQQNAGHYDAAYDLLRHSIDINPQAAEAWFYLSIYQGEMGKDSLAMECMERAATLNPANDTYQEQLAQYYINTRQFGRATAVYERLANNNHNRLDVLNILIQLYQQEKNYDGMISSLNRIEGVEGPREETTLAKMRIYELKGDQKAAWKTLKSLADDHPSDVNYRVMMGNWLMQNNRQKEAEKLFVTALKEEPDNAYTQASLYDYYRSQGQDSLARQMMLNIITSPKSTTENKAIMMRQAIQENEQASRDSTEILRLFDRILLVSPKDSDMAEMRVAYMTLKHMPTDSINKGLRQLLDIAPENSGARLQLLGSYLRTQDWDNVVDICQNGTQYNPDEMVFYYYEGLARYQQERTDEALSAFRRGVAQVKNNNEKEMVADLYYFMGDILHQKERNIEAFAAYDSCLQWKADHTACLNNYAYYLCLENRDLARAEQMSYKTIKEEPDNANHLDTYAWILFRQERYTEALIYIDQALACDTDSVQSAVLLEHAGDIHCMAGDLDKAMEYWQQALDAGSKNVDLIEQKILYRKYIESKP